MTRQKSSGRQMSVTILIGLTGLILITVVVKQNTITSFEDSSVEISKLKSSERFDGLRNTNWEGKKQTQDPLVKMKPTDDRTTIFEKSNFKGVFVPVSSKAPEINNQDVMHLPKQVDIPALGSGSPTIKGSQMIEHLLSAEATHVSSDVRGNLGPASVVINENMSDWLKDRWQAASNMKGTPIFGEHYLLLTLRSHAIVTRCLIDWETAYSDHYSISGGNSSTGPFHTLAESADRVVISTMHQHIVHALKVKSNIPIQFIRLTIKRPSTEWGVSIWRFQVYGYYI